MRLKRAASAPADAASMPDTAEAGFRFWHG